MSGGENRGEHRRPPCEGAGLGSSSMEISCRRLTRPGRPCPLPFGAPRRFFVGRASRLPWSVFFHRPSAVKFFDSQAGRLRYIGCTAALFFLALASAAFAAPERIVTAGAAVTEIVAGLGLGDRLVAVDTSSRALHGMGGKPDVGYVRMLGAEGVLSQKPDLVVVSSEAGPAAVLDQIRGAGVEVVVVDAGRSLENVDEKISQVAGAVGRQDKGAEMRAEFRGQLEKLQAAVASIGERPSVIFLHARGGNNLMAAGSGTAAHAMIEACGGINAGAGFEGYKPLSAEAFAAMGPDFVLVSESVLGTDGELLQSVPGLAQTPAARNGRILRVEDAAFLGFGPRSASAARLVAARFAQP